MANDNLWEDDDDNEEPTGSDLVKQLRKQLKDSNAAKKAFEDELKTLRPTVRKTQVSSVLTKLNVNPKIAGLVPSDVEATEDGIKAWVEEYGDIFGATPASPEASAATDTSSSAAVEEDPAAAAQAAQWGRIQSQQSASGVTTPDQETQQLAALQAAHAAAKGDTDKFFAYLSGAEPIPN